MIQFDYIIFFRWVETTNYLQLVWNVHQKNDHHINKTPWQSFTVQKLDRLPKGKSSQIGWGICHKEQRRPNWLICLGGTVDGRKLRWLPYPTCHTVACYYPRIKQRRPCRVSDLVAAVSILSLVLESRNVGCGWISPKHDQWAMFKLGAVQTHRRGWSSKRGLWVMLHSWRILRYFIWY